MEISEELKQKIIKGAEYMENGEPLKDAMDERDIYKAIDYLAYLLGDD